MMNRRRFITVSAAAMVATPARAAPLRWHGRAMGAEVSLTLYGAEKADLAAAVAEIRAAENRFSIYDPASELSRINARGGGTLSGQMSELLRLCDVIHEATQGLFDPTIQPVFRALFEGRTPPWHLVGWNRVQLSKTTVTLQDGQAVTLNGIAQGFATDRVRDVLKARGFTKALVSIGEQAAIGGPFRLALEDPDHGMVGTRTLEDRAIATSSPGVMPFGELSHIFDPGNRALAHWSTVSVEAKTAALADGLSTALCLLPRREIEDILANFGARATLIGPDGDVTTIS